MLSEELNQNHQLPENLPSKRNKAEAASAEFWRSIRTVIGLQNQAPPLQIVSRDEALPLSFPQERLWLLDQLAPSSSSYNIPMGFRIRGLLHVPTLEQSLNEVVRRHEVLRTTFAIAAGQPVQVIAPIATATISVVDLRERPEAERETQALQLATEEAQRCFDLSQGPLLRATLLQLGEDDYLAVLTVHHIAFDGWSAGVLFQELAGLYEAFSTGKPSPLPELPIQYGDFAVWQKQWLQGEFLEVLLSFWRQQLEGGLPMQFLPTDRPRPVVQTRRSACQTLVLSETLTEALKMRSRREGATLFAMLLAAFKALLHCYTAQDDLFVCAPTANRNRSEAKGVIGYFVNLLVLRTDLSGDPSFRELLSRVRQGTAGAYAHQDLPFQQLVNSLNLTHAPLSQVMFVLQNVPRQPLELSGATVCSVEIDNGTADFDLFLSMQEEGENLTGVVKYNTDLFDDETIAQMLQHFQLLLESVVVNPEQSLSSLPQAIGCPTLPVPDRARLQLERAYASGSPWRAGHSAEHDNAAGDRPREYVAPRSALELQVTKLWEEILGIQPIGVRDNFFELGGTSFLALRLFGQIEQVFGRNLPLSTLFQAPTVEQHAAILLAEEWSAPWELLVPIQSGNKTPLFCVHPIDGNVLIYQNLARHLGPRPVYGIQAKGLDGRESPLNRFEDMAAEYIKQIRTVQPEGPYLLAGYSSGGVVVFEMAQQLQAQGQKVAVVALFDTYCPNYLNPLSPHKQVLRHLSNLLRLEPKEKLTYFRGGAEQILQKLVGKLKHGIKRLDRADRTDRANAADSNLIDKNPDETLPDIFAPQKQAVLEAIAAYVPQVYSDRVTLFRCSNRPWWTANDLGWGERAASRLEIREIPGDHWSIIRENVQILAEQLRDCLDSAALDH